jgi:hypothetical protein
MMGYQAEAGLIPRICRSLIRRAESEKLKTIGFDFKLEASFLEIYCERVRDLYVIILNCSKHLLFSSYQWLFTCCMGVNHGSGFVEILGHAHCCILPPTRFLSDTYSTQT